MVGQQSRVARRCGGKRQEIVLAESRDVDTRQCIYSRQPRVLGEACGEASAALHRVERHYKNHYHRPAAQSAFDWFKIERKNSKPSMAGGLARPVERMGCYARALPHSSGDELPTAP